MEPGNRNLSEDDHLISLQWQERDLISIGAVIEATGLFLNAFVENHGLHDRTYEYSFESDSPQTCLIRAHLRHPLTSSRLEQNQAFAPLYVLSAAWFLAGANVTIEGPWKDSFPSQGCLHHEAAIPLKLQPLFQDELSAAERSSYPTFQSLAEIHESLSPFADWKEVKQSTQFQERFPQAIPDPRSGNNIRLLHRNGPIVDLIVKQGKIYSHILQNAQEDIRIGLGRMGCDRQVQCVRTWWDAWIGHCPTTGLAPNKLLVLPDEVALLSVSNAIHRYRLQAAETLKRPLQVDFGPGVHPTRSIDSWLGSAKRFGESKWVDVAIACSEQALETANAMNSNMPGLSIPMELGKSKRDLLNDAEKEYLRWLDYRESLEKSFVPHERWKDAVTTRGVQQLFKQIGDHWQPAIDELIEAINTEHFESEDYRRQIGKIRSFFWTHSGEYGSLRYDRVFGRSLMDAEVPKAAMKALGYEFREEFIPGYLEFEDIFTMNLGKANFWGSVSKRVLVSCENPTIVYRL
jgi:hypothetical protein